MEAEEQDLGAGVAAVEDQVNLAFFFLIVSMVERWFFAFLNLLFFLWFAPAYLLKYLNNIINDPLSGL